MSRAKKVLLIFPAGPCVNLCRYIAKKALGSVHPDHFAKALSSTGARPVSHYMCITKMTAEQYSLIVDGDLSKGVPGMNSVTYDYYSNHPLTAQTGDPHVYETIDLSVESRSVGQILDDSSLKFVEDEPTDIV